VTFSIPHDKGAEALRELQSWTDSPVLPIRAVLRTAGRISFYAGFVPVLCAFLSQLWAVVTAEARHAPGTLRVVRTRRLEHSIRWLVAFFEQAASPPGLAFSIPYKPRPTDFLCFIVDASPWGIGGVELIEGRCNRWFWDRIHPSDETALQVTAGEPGSVSTFEGLAILVACRLWKSSTHVGTRVSVRSDSLSALTAVA
jgi:hypothetical protein